MFTLHKICVLSAFLLAIVHADDVAPRNLRGETFSRGYGGGGGGGARGGHGGISKGSYGGKTHGAPVGGGFGGHGGPSMGRYGGVGAGPAITTPFSGGGGGNGYGGGSIGPGAVIPFGGPSVNGPGGDDIAPVSGDVGIYPGTGVGATPGVLPIGVSTPVEQPALVPSFPAIGDATQDGGAY